MRHDLPDIITAAKSAWPHAETSMFAGAATGSVDSTST
jgi:hypothetical protein